MQVYPLKTVTESIKRFFKKEERNSLRIAYDVKLYHAIYLVSLKILKNFIEQIVIAVEIYLYFWYFLDS